MARENNEILKNKSGMSVKTGDNKKLYIGLFCATLICAVGITVSDNAKKIPNNKENVATIVMDKNKDKEKTQNNNQKVENNSVKQEENQTETPLNAKALKDAIETKKFELIAKMLKDSKTTKLSELEIDIINEAKELMINEGIRELYKNGTTAFNTKDFGKAKDKFLIALDYSKGTYLDAHITYMLSVALENLGENQEAIKYYTKYIELEDDKEGSYREEVLYKLAILNKEIDIEKSKKFARKLANEYSNSIYNNDNIKAILNN